MRKQTTITCASCGKESQKNVSEVKRNERKGRKSYCNLKCSALGVNNLGEHFGVGSSNIKQYAGNRGDEFSPFRYFARKAKSRNKEKGFVDTDVTPEYLSGVWKEQKGICPLSGWSLDLPPNRFWEEDTATPKTASLDRIRPGEPYMQGNVRFIANIANRAKYTYTDQDVIEFCEAVSNNGKLAQIGCRRIDPGSSQENC
jgi:hypothetical protein